MPSRCFQTPTGPFEVTEEDGVLTGATWRVSGAAAKSALLLEAQAQIGAYYKGVLTRFDLPLRVVAGEFQRRVCSAITAIPHGETRTYGEIATGLGVSAQSVGRGCGGNPLPLLIPCHRVLGASGLGGFSGGAGIDTKVWLLRHEDAAGLLI